MVLPSFASICQLTPVICIFLGSALTMNLIVYWNCCTLWRWRLKVYDSGSVFPVLLALSLFEFSIFKMILRVVGIDSEKRSIGSDPFYVVVRHFDCINSFWIWPVAKWKWDLVELMKAYSDTLGRLVKNISAFDAAWVLFKKQMPFSSPYNVNKLRGFFCCYHT